MRVRELEVLQRLVGLGSVSEVARVMHTTQPNVSKILKKLEDHFGFAIFERQGGRLQLTEEGRSLSQEAEVSLMSVQRLEQHARNLREMRHGNLVVGTTPQISREWLPNIAARFMLDHPAVFTSVYTRTSRNLVESISQRQMHYAIGAYAKEDPNVLCEKLFDTELLAALPIDHPLCKKEQLAPSDFHGVDFISATLLDRVREVIENFLAIEGSVPKTRGEASLSFTRLHFVEHGLGVAMIDGLTALDYEGSRVAFRSLLPKQHLSVWSMKYRFQAKSRVLERFESFVEKQVLLDFANKDWIVLPTSSERQRSRFSEE